MGRLEYVIPKADVIQTADGRVSELRNIIMIKQVGPANFQHRVNAQEFITYLCINGTKGTHISLYEIRLGVIAVLPPVLKVKSKSFLPAKTTIGQPYIKPVIRSIPISGECGIRIMNHVR